MAYLEILFFTFSYRQSPKVVRLEPVSCQGRLLAICPLTRLLAVGVHIAT